MDHRLITHRDRRHERYGRKFWYGEHPIRSFIAVLLLLVCGQAFATVLPCPQTSSSGALTLNCINPRSGGAGISPLLAFFNCSNTTDTSLTENQTVAQDVTFIWNFNDRSPISGAGTWSLVKPGQTTPSLTGSGSAYRYKNSATGFIAAHMYQVDSNITPGATDSAYTAIVQASDAAGNTATCGMSITVFDASGSNGFGGSKTTCVAATTTPVAGAGSCPVGANVLETPSFTTATSTSNLGAGRRVLLRCGDTFTGGTRALGANPTTASSGTPVGTATPVWSLGAYGACPGTQSGRPIISQSEIQIDWASMDGRVADLDLEGSAATPPVGLALAIGPNFAVQATPAIQTTLFNLLCNGYDECYYPSECTQCGYIQLVETEMGVNQGTFINFAENNCQNADISFECGGTPAFTVQDYVAMIGGFYNGNGGVGTQGVETVRDSAGDFQVIENNTVENGNVVGAALKFHCGQDKNTQPIFLGKPCMLDEIADNLFTGSSGGQLVEVCAQNGETDERMMEIVVERNLFLPVGTNGIGESLLICVNNASVRDNVFNSSQQGVDNAIQSAQRGVAFGSVTTGTSVTTCPANGPPSACTGSTGAPVDLLYPHNVEIHHNTIMDGGNVTFAGDGPAVDPGNNSIVMCNLSFNGGTPSVSSGTGNTQSNNTTAPGNNPDFLNDSGAFSFVTDFKPAANFSGCTTVPVLYDALGQPWSTSTDLGAVQH
jgi:hypothetical protein